MREDASTVGASSCCFLAASDIFCIFAAKIIKLKRYEYGTDYW